MATDTDSQQVARIINSMATAVSAEVTDTLKYPVLVHALLDSYWGKQERTVQDRHEASLEDAALLVWQAVRANNASATATAMRHFKDVADSYTADIQPIMDRANECRSASKEWVEGIKASALEKEVGKRMDTLAEVARRYQTEKEDSHSG